MSSIDIVIVNWNAGVQLQACVESIFAFEDEAVRSVTIVDNGSGDGSVDFCRTDPRVRLIEPGRNLGFGTACNLGATDALGDYILFLNPDTRLLRPTLRAVADVMDAPSAQSIGVCGIRLVDEAGRTSRHCARLPTPRTFFEVSLGISKLFPRYFPPVELIEFDHDHDSLVPHVMGAFYLIRASVFRGVGEFDPKFFVYYEDLDLSLRVQAHGKLIFYLSSQSIFHRAGGTTGRARAKPLSYLYESRMIYAHKHYSVPGRMLIALGVLGIEPVRRSIHALLSGSISDLKEAVRASIRLWVALNGRPIDRT